MPQGLIMRLMARLQSEALLVYSHRYLHVDHHKAMGPVQLVCTRLFHHNDLMYIPPHAAVA